MVLEYMFIAKRATCSQILRAIDIPESSIRAALLELERDGEVHAALEKSGRRGGMKVFRLAGVAERPRTIQEVVHDGLILYGPMTITQTSAQLDIPAGSARAAIVALTKRGDIAAIEKNEKREFIYGAFSESKAAVHEQVLARIVALGGGPFGLMAAQLGATA